MTELKVMQPPVAVQAERPLCVDLDGTLVKSDTFVDSLMVLARRHPAGFFAHAAVGPQGKGTSQVAGGLPWSRSMLPICRTTVPCWTI